jgi:hypothetical protein
MGCARASLTITWEDIIVWASGGSLLAGNERASPAPETFPYLIPYRTTRHLGPSEDGGSGS